jgi:processive 1,2-diacylglycerol beta-glucosyltransferase
MKKSLKVLFLSAPIGGGHQQAAMAIAQAMQRINHDVVIQHHDIFEYLNKFLGCILLSTYFKSLSFLPQVYANAYAWGNESKWALLMRRRISCFFANKIKLDLLDYAPDIVVCTHATPAGMMEYLKEECQIDFHTVGVVTDFVVHRLWINKAIKQYFVAEESLLQDLIKYQVKQEQGYAFGIPVSIMCGQNYDKNMLLARGGFSKNSRVVLLMGGGAGLFPMIEVLHALNQCKTELQLIAVCGKNKKLYDKIQKIKQSIKHDMKVFGFINNVHELMAMSDVLISKAGGLTVSEALCSALPMLIYKPIPGQEEENTKFLIEKKVAIRIDKISTLEKVIDKIFRIESNVLDHMKINAKKISKPNAAENIADCILNNLCK